MQEHAGRATGWFELRLHVVWRTVDYALAVERQKKEELLCLDVSREPRFKPDLCVMWKRVQT